LSNDFTLSIIIPTKNEERTIEEIVLGCKKYSDEVIVVDGHSTDNTVKIAERLGCKVVFDNKKGKGDAIRCGIQAAQNDIIVFIDADGSHHPDDIPTLIQPIIDGTADHVSGSRMRGGSDELHGTITKFCRMVASDVITLSINYRFGVDLTDSQNGFRALKTELAKKLKLKENITTIEQEMIIKTIRLGYRMGEVPIHEYARKYGESSINLYRAGFRYI
jgi:dolichol-phosphate mannosyltransferase